MLQRLSETLLSIATRARDTQTRPHPPPPRPACAALRRRAGSFLAKRARKRLGVYPLLAELLQESEADVTGSL